MSCTALGANPPIQEIVWCAMELGAGGYAMAAALVFVLMLYGMYKLKLPFIVQVPVGLFTLFVFAGAGDVGLRAGGLGSFTVMMWAAIMVMGAITALVFWRLRK